MPHAIISEFWKPKGKISLMIQFLVRHKLKVALVLAVLVRLAFLIVLAPTLDFEQAGNAIHGSEAYDAYAVNLLETGVYGRTAGVPDAAIPPFYSYALALMYGLFGRGFIQVGLFHILLDVISMMLLYDITRRLGMRHDVEKAEWVGVVAVLCFAFYPYLVFQNLTLVDTAIWITLMHMFVWTLVGLREHDSFDRGTLYWAIGGGVVLGVATLTRPITPPIALFGAVWFLFRLSFTATVARLLPVALISAMFVAGWVVRNFNELDAFIPMTTTSGANLWQGNSEWTVPVFRAGYDVQWTSPEQDPNLSVRDADSERFDLAIEHWESLSFPEFVELFWVKFTVHWNIELTPRFNPQDGEQWSLDNGELVITQTNQSISGVTQANTSYDSGLLNTVGRPIHIIYFGGLWLFAWLGIWLSRREWREYSMIIFVQISMTAIYIFFHPSTRYRAPSDPLLFIFSAIVIVQIGYMILQRRQLAQTE